MLRKRSLLKKSLKGRGGKMLQVLDCKAVQTWGLPSIDLQRKDFTESQLSNGHLTQQIATVFFGDFAEITGSELGALDVGQAVNVELQPIETGG
jgi:hypothetical protein